VPKNSLSGGYALTIAVYPGTFDPAHYGHIDIAKRAAGIFDKVVVGVYDRPQKNLMFSTAERLVMLSEALRDVPNIEVRSYNKLTVDFVKQQGATVIVRGLRVISDFEMEYQMALMTRRLAPDVDVVCLMTSLEYAFISSSIVKDIALAGGSVAQFVPSHVEEALRMLLASRR
jgi:pantetheine-phosphate adenylyltransferase